MNSPTQGREEAIERGARAIHAIEYEGAMPYDIDAAWEGNADERELARRQAQAVLDAACPTGDQRERQQTEGDDREWTICTFYNPMNVTLTKVAKETDRLIPVVPKSRLIAAEQRADEVPKRWKEELDEVEQEREALTALLEQAEADKDRLQRERDNTRRALTEMTNLAAKHAKDAEGLQRENERLREALRRVERSTKQHLWTAPDYVRALNAIARQALESKSSPDGR